MITPINKDSLLEIQNVLEEQGIYVSLALITYIHHFQSYWVGNNLLEGKGCDIKKLCGFKPSLSKKKMAPLSKQDKCDPDYYNNILSELKKLDKTNKQIIEMNKKRTGNAEILL